MIYECQDVTVRNAIESDADYFSDHMRAGEVSEIWDEAHVKPKEAVLKSIRNSSSSFTFLYRGKIAGVFGVFPESIMSNRSKVWMLTTDHIYEMKHRFLKVSKMFIKALLEMNPILWNYVDAKNEQCVRWLKWCGAKVSDAVPYGIEKKPFHYFELRGQ